LKRIIRTRKLTPEEAAEHNAIRGHIRLEYPANGGVPHVATLTYTIQDDGVWLYCSCGAQINLGYSPTLCTAQLKHLEHAKKFRRENRQVKKRKEKVK